MGKKKSFNIQKAREFVREKQRRLEEERHVRFERAWHDFNKIIAMLINKYNPKRIYQWGSLLNEKHFSEISDIDIAVEGIKSAEEYFAMLGDAMQLTDISLDLIEIEKIEPIYAKGIREKGRIVYERK